MHTSSLYWFTLTPRATSSPQKLLGFYYAIKTRTQTTKRVTLSPLRNTLLLAQQSTEIRSPCDFALIPNYRNTVIKEEENKIHLGITKLKDQKYTPILFHTLENPKLDVNLENLKLNLHYDFSKLFFLLSRSV